MVRRPDLAPATRFRRYVPTVAALLCVALCIAAGNWQRARMHYKQGLRAQYDAALAAPALRASDIPAAPADLAGLRYRTVELTGAFDNAHTFLLDNQVQGGRVGYDVVSPLRMADARVVLVDRGWVVQGRTRAELPALPAPAGPVTLRGRIVLPPRAFDLEARKGTDSSWPVVWQRLDLDAFERLSGAAVLPVLIEQTAPLREGDQLVRAWPDPDFGVDTHRIYMVQWYAFAAIAIVFWTVTHRPWRWLHRPSAHADVGESGRP